MILYTPYDVYIGMLKNKVMTPVPSTTCCCLTKIANIQVNPWDIMQDIVDQAQMVYFLANKVTRKEVHAQTALQQRLRDMGYQVDDEVWIASRILNEPEKDLDRVDLLVDNKVVVELKLGNDISELHRGQLRRYMSLPKLAAIAKHGVLIAFPKTMRPLAITAHSAIQRLNDRETMQIISFQPDFHPSLAALTECLQLKSLT